MFIKESYVHKLPADINNPTDDEGMIVYRWVGCECGYERTAFDSNYLIRGKAVLLRMFKVNGAQVCEGCLKEWRSSITEWIE
jgi:hypothetical protein